jgi:hypothetical protein
MIQQLGVRGIRYVAGCGDPVEESGFTLLKSLPHD